MSETVYLIRTKNAFKTAHALVQAVSQHFINLTFYFTGTNP